MDQPGTIDNPANRENENIPVSVRGREFDLARRVRPSRPASACSFSILRLNLVLIHGIPLAFHDSVHIYIYIYVYHQPPSVQSRVYQVTPLRTDGVHCRESAGTGPVTGGAAFSGFTMGQLVCASLSSHPRSSGGCGAGLTLKRCSQLVAFAIQSFSRPVETWRRYGWLRMVFPGARLFRAPLWCPSGGWRHARGREHCRGESGNVLSGGYAPDSAKAKGSSFVDESGEG